MESLDQSEFLDQPGSSNQSESPDWLGSIDKRTQNVSISRGASPSSLEENCLDKDILVTSLELVSRTGDS